MGRWKYVTVLVAIFLISLVGSGHTGSCPFGLCGEGLNAAKTEKPFGSRIKPPDFGDEIREALSEFKDAVAEAREELGLSVFVPFTKKVWPAGTPVAEVLRANGLTYVFEPPDLEKRVVVKDEEVFSSLADLALYLERSYKLFTVFRDGQVYVSTYAKKTYNVDFAEGYLSKKTIQALLHGDLAYANYFPETGRLVVYDDWEGQKAVQRYLKDLARRIRRVYAYEIHVKHRTRAGLWEDRVYRGEVVAGRSSPLGDVGFIRVFPGDSRAMVYVTFPEFPARTYTFLVKREGGDWEAQDGEWAFQVRIKLRGTKLCSKWEIEEF